MSQQGAGTEINVAEVMRRKVAHQVDSNRNRPRNPAIPNDPFEAVHPDRSGLPADFDYHPVEVPNPSAGQYQYQHGILQAYIHAGWQFLDAELVSRDGRNGMPIIPNFEAIDGRVVVAGCYIMFADKGWVARNRAENVEGRNAILGERTQSRAEELEATGDSRNKRTVTSERRDVTLEELNEKEGTDDDD